MCLTISRSSESLKAPLQVKQQMACIDDIPDDVLTHIFSFLGKDRENARLVCKHFYECFPATYELDLSNHSSLTAEDLQDIIKAFPELRSLKLPAGTTGAHLIILEKCDRIKSLDISSASIAESDLYHLNPNIEELVCHFSNLSDAAVKIIVSKCPNLLKLELLSDLTGESLKFIGQHCKNLKHLYLMPRRIDNLSEVIEELAEGCPSLEVLTLPFNGDDVLISLAEKLTQLKELHYLRSENREGIKKLVERCPLLEVLDFSFTKGIIYPPGYIRKKMESTEVTPFNGLLDDTLEEIGFHCKNLKVLIIPYASSITDLGTNTLTHLEKFVIGFSKITPIGLRILGENCPNLKWFECDGGTRIQDGVSLLVEQCHKLENISMHNVSATDITLKAIGKYCPHLKTLDCSVNNMSDSGIIELAQGCKELESIVFFRGHHFTRPFTSLTKETITYESLDVISAVTDASLVALGANCHQLKDIQLFSNKFSDIGLLHLIQGTPFLENLQITGNDITNDILFRLNQYCPDLRTLKIGHCSKITDAGARYVMCYYQKLKKFALEHSGVSSPGLSAIYKHYQNPQSPNPWLTKADASECCTLL